MIYFILFVSIVLGINLRYNFSYTIVLTIVYLIFVLVRFKKKVFLLSLLFLGVGIGLSFIQLAYKRDAYLGIIVDAKANYFIVNSFGEKLYISSYNNAYEIGDFVKISGQKYDLCFSKLESGFDFENYLFKKGIVNGVNVSNIDVIWSNFIKIKRYREIVTSGLNENAKALANALFFNSRDNDSSIIEYANALHLMRLVSASGIYIYFFVNSLTSILKWKLKDKVSELIAIIVVIPYLLFTFPKLSVVKIILLLLIKWINKYLLHDKFDYLTLLSIVGFTLLFVDYHLATQDSFILGFSIPFITYYTRPLLSRKKVWFLLISNLPILIFFIPFSLSYYHEVSLLSPLYVTFLSPIFILYAVIGSLLFVRIPVQGFINGYANFIEKVLKSLTKVNPLIYASPLGVASLSFFLLIYLIYIYYSSIQFKPIIRWLHVVIIGFFLIRFIPINHIYSSEVSFINVGQGDSCLIRDHNKTILIDTGGNIKSDIAKDNLIPFLKRLQIYRIDLLITTHDDYDHSGALPSLVNNFPVTRYVKEPQEFPIKIGNTTFTNYNNVSSSGDENENSLVISFHILNKDFVIAGDAPISIEKQIMAIYSSIPCDVLKVGHHGSNTSTSDEWLTYLSPKEAIISCGLNNKYGHPHEVVINRLKKHHIKILRTDLMGTITYKNYISI